MFSKIMIPIDLTHTDQMGRALSVAADLASRHGAEAHIVGVTQSSPTEIARTPEAFAEKLSAYAAERSKEYGIPFVAHTEISHDMRIDLDDVLQRVVNRIGADLIVMASHVPGFAEHIFSSNAGYLASHTDVSVFIVR